MFAIDAKIRRKLKQIDELETRLAAYGEAQAFVEFDSHGTVQNASGAFLRLTSTDLHDVLGTSHGLLFDTVASGEPTFRQLWHALADGKEHVAHLRCAKQSGRAAWLRLQYHPLQCTAGELESIVAFVNDVTAELSARAVDKSRMDALDRSHVVVEFAPNGTIVRANELFRDVFGYRSAEISGLHHDTLIAGTTDEAPWSMVATGRPAALSRFTDKDGGEVWLEASYNQVVDGAGDGLQTMLVARDITCSRRRSYEIQGILDAVNRSRASISFDLDGTILDANENFLALVGYALTEIRGRHHRMLVDAEYAASAEYRAIWERLRSGQFHASVFRYLDKNGCEIWISATYNPIFGAERKPVKIVKFARNITDIVNQRQTSERLVDVTLDRIAGAVASVNDRSSVAVAASEQTSGTVQAVAAAAEELNASILEITRSMTSSRAAVATVIDEARSVDGSAQRLSDQAGTMTSVVELIDEIAKRINLLSLNATIESARAGEAGRGFAVVASQVKSLAQQVSSATEKIGQEILEMQGVVREVVDGLSAIRQSVTSVQGAVINTASAVEEQSAVTREISTNMQYAARSVSSVNANLLDILHAVEQANEFACEGKKIYSKAIADVTVL